MQGLMMDYQLTLDRILEHANRMFSPQIYSYQIARRQLP